MTTTQGALARPAFGTQPDYSHSVFVTGATSGIGRAVSLALLDHGFHVFGGAINQAEADSLATSFPPQRVTPIVLDIRDETSVQNAAKTVADQLDGIKLKAVCNIAGVIVNGPLADLTGDAFQNVLAVNVVGTHNVTRAMLPLMGPGSRVVNMSSASGLRTLPFTGAYSASKFGLEALTTAMRMEFAPLGIKAIAIAPGMINTPMADRIQQELSRPPSLDIYAEPLRRFLAKTIDSATHGIPMSRVVHTVVEAINTDKPAPRYDLHHSYLQDAILMRILPIRIREAVVARVLGLTSTNQA